MRDFNQFVASGTVGHVEENENNTRVAVYVHDDYKDKEGDWVNQAYPLNVTFFGGQAEFAKSLQVRDSVIVSGKIVIKKDKDGNYATYFNGNSVTRMNFNSPDSSESTPKKATKKRSKYSRGKEEEPEDEFEDEFDDEFEDV